MHIFEERVALVTGGIRGIGRAIARKFAASGADIVINDKKWSGSSQTLGESLLQEIREMGRRAIFVLADISQKESVKKIFEETQNSFGRLDFLILNAAQAPFKPFERLLVRDLQQLVAINYFGNIFCIQEALPLLEKTQGKIVFLSSLGSRFYNPSYPLGSMKAAMETVIRDCAESFREKKISVNGVCGGVVNTDSFKVLRQYWEGVDTFLGELLQEPEEMADVVHFLCTPESRGINGQTIVVDRGLSNTLYRPIKKR